MSINPVLNPNEFFKLIIKAQGDLREWVEHCTCPFHDSDGELMAGIYPCKIHPEADFCEVCGGTGIKRFAHTDQVCPECERQATLEFWAKERAKAAALANEVKP